LKAALSAAIKVTITSTLVGCGGMMTSSGGGPDREPSGSAGSGGSDTAGKSPLQPASYGYPTESEPASGGTAGAEPITAATAPGGGAPAGGMASAAAGGSAGAAGGGAPAATCTSAEVDACYAFLAQADVTGFGNPLPAADQACCRTLLDSLVSGEPGSVCRSDNTRRFDPSPARRVCCSDPASWSVYPSCAPWGPPVPPELSLEA